jgi:hypothetical protein
MSKIAPELQWFHLQSVGRHRTKAMAAELRALLGVAAALGAALKSAEEHYSGDASNSSRPLAKSYQRSLAAWARLARASSPGGGRGSK